MLWTVSPVTFFFLLFLSFLLRCSLYHLLQVILVGSSINERDQMLFISTDEGSSFQRQSIDFTPDTLIFHPKEEDKLLAYCKEGRDILECQCVLFKISSSNYPFLFPDCVTVSCPVAVHVTPGYLYVTCLIQNCSDKMVTAQFLGKIDRNSLLVQDDYVFVKVTTGNRTKHYVSYRRNEFVQMRFPKYALPKRVHANIVGSAVVQWDFYLFKRATEITFCKINPSYEKSISFCQVRGIKGVFLANQKIDGRVATVITYNKGRDWEPLAPPTTDMNGKPVSCKAPDCHLHLHLRWADNPYVSGTVHTKDSAPGLIMGAGNLGSKLVEYKEEMYISSDCGKTWRQVFEEEHHILYLDHGGVIVAIKDTSIPLKILKFSIDEGRTWNIHNFTSTSVFVDGLLSEPGDETLVMTPLLFQVFAQTSITFLLSEQLLIFMMLKCLCSDYGFERSHMETDRCIADFWYDPDSPPEDCHLGQTYMSSTGYRKMISNSFGIKGQMLAVAPGDDITFTVHQEQGDTSSTKYQVDLGDGVRAIYQNLTVTDEPIQHRYENPGIYKVKVKAENMAGHDEATMYIQVTAPLQEVHLEVVPIAGRNHEVNLTATVLPSEANLTVFYWWIGDSMQPILTLQNNLLTRFPGTGRVSVTVQATNSRSMVQDTRTVRVYDNFQVIPLSFSRNLDRFNPNIPEWRDDIGQVVTKILAKITGVPQNSLVTVVKPGLPTTANLYVLPLDTKPAKRSLFQHLLVSLTQISTKSHLKNAMEDYTAPSYKNNKSHSPWLRPEDAYPPLFFRKLPCTHNYAQMHSVKEQEMISPVNHSEDTQQIIQGEEKFGSYRSNVKSLEKLRRCAWL
uniref:Sortilin-related VPS10 domain containing receptor 2 n=1 Tax=Neolamprologus brichardi TaxID=32507 RepID=A0A3Q4HCH0_NEOBR